MKTGIYKITSPNNRVYIGQSIDLIRREKHYSGDDFKQQIRLYLSIKKYGWSNHIFEVIEYCHLTDLNCRERHWQDYYNVLGKSGLNCVLQECGELRKVYSEEVKNKISLGNKGKTKGRTAWNKGKKMKPMTKEVKDKISKSNTGKVLSQETRDKISSSNLGKIRSKESKENISRGSIGRKLSQETKNKISLIHKGKALSEEHKNKLSALNKGKSKSEETIKKMMKPITQFSKNMEFIKDWVSGKNIEDELGISRSHISSCCNNKKPSAGGFIWKFKINK